MTGLYPDPNTNKDFAFNPELEFYQEKINEMQAMRNEKKKDLQLFDFTIYKEFDSWCGIFRCNVFAPDEADLIEFSPIPVREEQKDRTIRLRFPNCDQKNLVLTTDHFKALILAGWTIELVKDEFNTVFFTQGYVMKEFVDSVGALKARAKENNNKAFAKFVKMVLNSLSGKMAQKPYHRIQEQTMTLGESMNNDLYVYEDYTKSKFYIAAFLNSKANFILFSYMYRLQQHNIYANRPLSDKLGCLLYCDTDSIVFDEELCYKVDFQISEEIGSYDAEKCDYNSTWKRKQVIYFLNNNFTNLFL